MTKHSLAVPVDSGDGNGDGDGDMGARVRAHAWAATPLGAMENWSPQLKSVVGIVLAAPFPTVLWWGASLTQLYNDAARHCFDVLKEPASLGQDAAVCWAGDWPLLREQIDRVIASHRAVRHKDLLIPIFRDGQMQECYWSYSYTPVFGDAGAVEGIMVASTETTARVLSERRQATLDRLRAELAGSETISEVRAATRQALSLVPRDVFGVRFPDDAADGATGRHVIIESGSPRPHEWFTLEFRLTDALPYDLAFERFLEQFTGIVAAAKQRIDADAARAIAADERDRLLLDAPVGAAVMIGEDLTYQLVNPIYAMVAGRDAGAMLGKAFVDVFPELDGSPVHQSFLSVYRAGIPFAGGETLVQIHKYGGQLEDRYFTYNLSPLRRLDGSVYGLMVIAVDVTVQVEARTSIQHLNAELHASSRAKDEFLALLGHELRNPLAPIVTALELMQLRDTTITHREQAVIRRQVTHLTRLVDDLLDVSRITRGKIELRKEDTALSGVAARAAEMVLPTMDRKKQVFAMDVGDIALHADPARLAQVLSNLLTNASRYTPEGGHIALRARLLGTDIVIDVADNGIGIPAELLPRIFEPFVQGERKLEGSVGGLGIGLALVRNLVQLHGGGVTARSDGAGQGSVFTIVIPSGMAVHAAYDMAGSGAPGAVPDGALPADAVPADAVPADAVLVNAAPAHTASGLPTSQPRLVLLVDDNMDAADFLAELLSAWGHTVRVAYDPEAALRACAEAPPELAILDIGLPGMDGYELARQLRRVPGCADLPCVALTGFGQQADKARSAEAAFAGHLVKPVEMRELARIFASLDN